MGCKHAITEVRKMIFSNGVVHYVEQCLNCGDNCGARKKSEIPEETVLVEFDKELRDRYRERELESRRLAWDAGRDDRRREYEQYLSSPEWRHKRDLVLIRDDFVCQGCLASKATEVHHLTYDNRGDELFFQLVSLCCDCHRKTHKRNPDDR